MAQIPVKVRAIFDPNTKNFNVQFGGQHVEMGPEQFAQIVEYLELVLASYTKYKKEQGKI